jgi:hypothetical protein
MTSVEPYHGIKTLEGVYPAERSKTLAAASTVPSNADRNYDIPLISEPVY